MQSMAILCTGSREESRQSEPAGRDQEGQRGIPFPFMHPVGKKRPDHNGSDADNVGHRRNEPGLEICDAEFLDDRRQPKAQTITGRRGAEIDEAEHENGGMLQRLP